MDKQGKKLYDVDELIQLIEGARRIEARLIAAPLQGFLLPMSKYDATRLVRFFNPYYDALYIDKYVDEHGYVLIFGPNPSKVTYKMEEIPAIRSG